ncbi:MAG: hypothetical protein HY544_01900 [Candidatus Diapherotrites archaeon]|uniref:ECF transporter S component n=1 Tax=Candidatus Iainarchaeum sp. TaxID=3101447 RepID=A0A8T3YKM1_9ARCH|nr:hypothetical protein [Candidatus Diapherotrites archaeon]
MGFYRANWPRVDPAILGWDKGKKKKGHGEHKKEHGGEHGHGDEGGDDDHDEGHEEHGGHEDDHDDHDSKDGHGGHKEGHDDNARAEHKDEHAAPPKPRKKLIGELDIITVLLLAVFGRVIIKQFPALVSIEPIIPLAVFAALTYGTDAGILVGLLAYPLSNIFLEGGAFGLFSVLQGIGGGLAGGIAGYAGKANRETLIYYSVIGTVIFEAAVNLPDQLIIVWPFSFIHIVSNIFIAMLIGELSMKGK